MSQGSISFSNELWNCFFLSAIRDYFYTRFSSFSVFPEVNFYSLSMKKRSLKMRKRGNEKENQWVVLMIVVVLKFCRRMKSPYRYNRIKVFFTKVDELEF